MPTADAPATQSAKAVAALQDYLGMGPDRSLRNLARGLGPSAREWSLDSLQRWSSQFGWVARAADYDGEIAKRAQRALDAQATREATDLKRKRLTRAARAGEIVDAWIEDRLITGTVHRLSGHVVVELARMAHETERLDNNEATTRQELTGSEHVFRIIHEDRRAVVGQEDTRVVVDGTAVEYPALAAGDDLGGAELD